MDKKTTILSNPELIDYIKLIAKELDCIPRKKDLKKYDLILKRFQSLNRALILTTRISDVCDEIKGYYK